MDGLCHNIIRPHSTHTKSKWNKEKEFFFKYFDKFAQKILSEPIFLNILGIISTARNKNDDKTFWLMPDVQVCVFLTHVQGSVCSGCIRFNIKSNIFNIYKNLSFSYYYISSTALFVSLSLLHVVHRSPLRLLLLNFEASQALFSLFHVYITESSPCYSPPTTTTSK
jgi:hypothetical protein